MIEISYFYRTQRSGGVPPPHLKTETDPVSETLWFLICQRIPDDGQSENPCNPELLCCFLVRSVWHVACPGRTAITCGCPAHIVTLGDISPKHCIFQPVYFQSAPFAGLLGIRPQYIINVKPSDVVFLLTYSISSVFLKLETPFVHCQSCLLALSSSIVHSNSVWTMSLLIKASYINLL
jgi:hypothetical protein